MARVLYLSYTGLLEPLGQSQVLQYLLKLSERHKITVFTFEKNLTSAHARVDLAERCAAAGIDWRPLAYRRGGFGMGGILNVVRLVLCAVRETRRRRYDLVHARSYIPALAGLVVKQTVKTRLLFDMRGFWPDERIDGGIWTRSSIPYRAFKALESRLLRKADHLVSLTRAGVAELERQPGFQGLSDKTTVIPTCTNLEVFAFAAAPPSSPFVLGYVGSAGTWYLFAEVAKCVRLLFEARQDALFLVVNQHDHAYIGQVLREAGVDLDRVEIRSASYADVPSQIARMSAGVFFIKPTYSKQASCPTKMGEFLAVGRPCLANGGVGDVESDIQSYGIGVAVRGFSTQELRRAVDQIVVLAASPDTPARCRAAAQECFSLESGVAAYDAIYHRLSKGRYAE